MKRIMKNRKLITVLLLTVISISCKKDDGNGKTTPISQKSMEEQEFMAEQASIILTTFPTNQVSFKIDAIGTVTVDWGDGTAVDMHTFSDLAIYFDHFYPDTTIRTVKIYGDVTYLANISTPLIELDVSNDVALICLAINGNQLTNLDVSKNLSLKELLCAGNQLTELDLSKNIALEWLNCPDNQLTSLDLSNNTALVSLWCSNNQLSAPALNALFETLHSDTWGSPVGGREKNLFIGDNPGTNSCDKSIAENKGWTIKNNPFECPPKTY